MDRRWTGPKTVGLGVTGPGVTGPEVTGARVTGVTRLGTRRHELQGTVTGGSQVSGGEGRSRGCPVGDPQKSPVPGVRSCVPPCQPESETHGSKYERGFSGDTSGVSPVTPPDRDGPVLQSRIRTRRLGLLAPLQTVWSVGQNDPEGPKKDASDLGLRVVAPTSHWPGLGSSDPTPGVLLTGVYRSSGKRLKGHGVKGGRWERGGP